MLQELLKLLKKKKTTNKQTQIVFLYYRLLPVEGITIYT